MLGSFFGVMVCYLEIRGKKVILFSYRDRQKRAKVILFSYFFGGNLWGKLYFCYTERRKSGVFWLVYG